MLEALDFQLGINSSSMNNTMANIADTSSVVDGNNNSGRGTYHKRKKLKQFVHCEERFTDVKQSVVIWCFLGA